MKRQTTKEERKVLTYLNSLRETGITNMFGASPYIINAFPAVDKNEARWLLSLWMQNFNDEGIYDTVTD